MKGVLVPFDLWDELMDFVGQRADIRDGGERRQLPNAAMTLLGKMEGVKSARPEVRGTSDHVAIDRIAHVLNTCQVRWEGDTVLNCISALVTAAIASREPQPSNQTSWNCPKCGYLNTPRNSRCFTCSESRDAAQSEDQK